MTGRAGPVGPPLRLTTSRPRPDVRVITAVGELDMATAPLLRAHLRREPAARPTHLVLDLTGVVLISAAGITVVVDALHADGDTGRLRVVAPPDGPVVRALRLTGVHALLTVHTDVAGALAALPP